jgi:hypothetical protein
MKIDIDSIFYIILSIIILAVSGLGSRRRRQAQQANKAVPSPGQTYGRDEDEEMKIPQARRPVQDPFDRLEEILTGQPRYESLEGESLEVLEDEEEAILDEEEAILDQRKAILDEEEEITKAPIPEMEEMQYDLPEEGESEKYKGNVRGLFRDLDEVTRAFIYSEIFPRKYK